MMLLTIHKILFIRWKMLLGNILNNGCGSMIDGIYTVNTLNLIKKKTNYKRVQNDKTFILYPYFYFIELI